MLSVKKGVLRCWERILFIYLFVPDSGDALGKDLYLGRDEGGYLLTWLSRSVGGQRLLLSDLSKPVFGKEQLCCCFISCNVGVLFIWLVFFSVFASIQNAAGYTSSLRTFQSDSENIKTASVVFQSWNHTYCNVRRTTHCTAERVDCPAYLQLPLVPS